MEKKEKTELEFSYIPSTIRNEDKKLLNNSIVQPQTSHNSNPNGESPIKSEGKLIITNIDNLYLHIKKVPNNIRNSIIILCFIGFIKEILFWNLCYQFTSPRQYNYCYDTYSNTIELYDLDYVCSKTNKALNIFIYLDNSTDYENFLNELTYMNKNYYNFFFNLSQMYFTQKYNILDKFESNQVRFNGCVIFTFLETNVLFLRYFQTCNVVSSLFIFVPFLIFGIFVANYIFCFLSDLFGRKNIFFIGVFSAGIGALGICLFGQFIHYDAGLETKNFEVQNRKFYEDTQFFFVLNLYKTKVIMELYSQRKIFIGLSIFLTFLGHHIVTTNGLALLLELSYNDEQVLKNYLNMFNFTTMSFLFSFILNQKLTYELSYGVTGAALIIMGFVCIFFLEESPRYLFEHAEWNEMTELLNKQIGKEEIERFYQPHDLKEKLAEAERIQNEELREELNKFLKEKYGRITFDVYKEELYIRIKKSNKLGKFYISFDKYELLENPGIHFRMMFYDKEINKQFIITGALLMVICINYYVSSNFLFSRTFFTRNNLFENYIFNTPNFFTTIFLIFSNYLYYFLQKFFGGKVCLSISLFCSFLMCSLNDLLYIDLNLFRDLNKYDKTKELTYVSDNYHIEKQIFIILLNLFGNGLVYCFTLYIISISKTAFRCSFLGMIFVIYKLMFFISGIFTIYVNKSMLFVGITSFIGLVATFLFEDQTNFNIIIDRRKVEISVNKKNV